MALWKHEHTRKRAGKDKRQLPKEYREQTCVVQTRPAADLSVMSMFGVPLTDEAAIAFSKALRGTIPIVDSAFCKIERLIGGFRFRCQNPAAEKLLNRFSKTVQVGASSRGLEHFVCSYLDSLLLYGNAVGEIVVDSTGHVAGLYNTGIEDVLLLPGDNALSVKICGKDEAGRPVVPKRPELLMFTALNPQPGKVRGQGILHSLPFVSSVLMKVYSAIGQNFDRIGNIRFAITYRPGENDVNRAYAQDRAKQIAKEWSEGMAASRHGDLRDFVTAGDVQIKVIGAENQMIDCDVPVRQMLEQIVAKLSVPPFMLGLSWSTTERMSEQQANMLSGELAYYRRLLDPVIMKIAVTFLRTMGYTDTPKIEWDVLNFKDEIQAAQTRLYNAQATKIELENGEVVGRIPVDVSAT